jgi:aminopeptidase N
MKTAIALAGANAMIGLAVAWAMAAGAAIDAQPQPSGTAAVTAIDVLDYDARVRPDLAARTVEGTVAITFIVRSDRGDWIEFDTGDLTIDSVQERGTPRLFAQRDHHVRIQLSGRSNAGKPRTVDIAYHGAPRGGMRFFPERGQVYTVFSTSQWLVCVDAPSDKATLRLRVIVPDDLRVAGNGRLVARARVSAGQTEYVWREDRPVPTYTFGFAAGRFTEVNDTRGRVQLRYLGDGFSGEELRRIFADTGKMLAFFEDRAGVPYGADRYTQALTADGAGQEMSGFAVLPEAYGRAVLSDEQAISLGAHETAHQWWGNQVTCREWTHFWLNEGFATFMAAAYIDHRFGRDPYLREMAARRARYEKVVDAGHDRSLVFPNWDRPTADDRTIVYQKGAVVLYELREALGDRPFWDGIRLYTRRHAGKSVTTEDFQRAMEQSAGRSLADFFAKWVY